MADGRILPDMARWDAANQARRDYGEPVRQAILRELLRREQAHEPAPTWTELGEAVGGLSHHTVRYHCRAMSAAGLVTWADRKPRTLRLTEAGRTSTTAASA